MVEFARKSAFSEAYSKGQNQASRRRYVDESASVLAQRGATAEAETINAANLDERLRAAYGASGPQAPGGPPLASTAAPLIPAGPGGPGVGEDTPLASSPLASVVPSEINVERIVGTSPGYGAAGAKLSADRRAGEQKRLDETTKAFVDLVGKDPETAIAYAKGQGLPMTPEFEAALRDQWFSNALADAGTRLKIEYDGDPRGYQKSMAVMLNYLKGQLDSRQGSILPAPGASAGPGGGFPVPNPPPKFQPRAFTDVRLSGDRLGAFNPDEGTVAPTGETLAPQFQPRGQSPVRLAGDELGAFDPTKGTVTPTGAIQAPQFQPPAKVPIEGPEGKIQAFDPAEGTTSEAGGTYREKQFAPPTPSYKFFPGKGGTTARADLVSGEIQGEIDWTQVSAQDRPTALSKNVDMMVAEAVRQGITLTRWDAIQRYMTGRPQHEQLIWNRAYTDAVRLAAAEQTAFREEIGDEGREAFPHKYTNPDGTINNEALLREAEIGFGNRLAIPTPGAPAAEGAGGAAPGGVGNTGGTPGAPRAPDPGATGASGPGTGKVGFDLPDVEQTGTPGAPAPARRSRLIEQAIQAIAMGVDSEAVVTRLRQLGIDLRGR